MSLYDKYAAYRTKEAHREAANREATRAREALKALELQEKLARGQADREAIIAGFTPILDAVGARELLEDAQKIWGTGDIKGPSVFVGPVDLKETFSQYSFSKQADHHFTRSGKRPHMREWEGEVAQTINGTGAEVVLEHYVSGNVIRELEKLNTSYDFLAPTSETGPFPYKGGNPLSSGFASIDYPNGRPATGPPTSRDEHTVIGIAAFMSSRKPMLFTYYLQSSESKPSGDKPQFHPDRSTSITGWFEPIPLNGNNPQIAKNTLVAQLCTFTKGTPNFKHPRNSS